MTHRRSQPTIWGRERRQFYKNLAMIGGLLFVVLDRP
jgi:hypothetical protein